MVQEAKSFDDVLSREIDLVNVKARELGVEKGVSVSEGLEILV